MCSRLTLFTFGGAQFNYLKCESAFCNFWLPVVICSGRTTQWRQVVVCEVCDKLKSKTFFNMRKDASGNSCFFHFRYFLNMIIVMILKGHGLKIMRLYLILEDRGQEEYVFECNLGKTCSIKFFKDVQNCASPNLLFDNNLYIEMIETR